MTYEEYINSDEWRNRRKRILLRDGFKCQMCGKAIQLEVHHIRYPDVYGQESDDDLITLCDSCHRTIHARDKEIKEKMQGPWWQRMSRWVNREKYRDFIYGGTENMCDLSKIKNSMSDYGLTTRSGELQHPLGYAHRQLVCRMRDLGYSAYDIEQRTPLLRQTIERYLKSGRRKETTWEYIIPVDEINRVVDQYINSLEGNT